MNIIVFSRLRNIGFLTLKAPKTIKQLLLYWRLSPHIVPFFYCKGLSFLIIQSEKKTFHAASTCLLGPLAEISYLKRCLSLAVRTEVG